MNTTVRKNYIFNLLFQVLNIAAPLITMPYVSRVLGASGVGEYSYTYSIVSYFLIFASLGTSLYGCREVAADSESKHKKSIVFFEILGIRIIASFLVLMGYFGFVNFYKFSQSERILLMVSSFYILAAALDISWFFQGDENFFIIMAMSLVTKIITIISVFALVRDQEDVRIYVLIHALLALVNSLLYYIKLPGRVERIRLSELNIRKHLMPVFVLLIPQVSKEVYGVLDKTMIGCFYSNRSLNGYYEQAMNIVSMSMTVITSLNIVKMSNLSHLSSKENEKINPYICNSFHFVWFMGIPLCFGIASVIPVFVPVFFGDGYEPVIQLVYVLLPMILIIGISNVIGIQYLITLKRHREFNFSIIMGLMSNVVFNLILIPKFNVFGAAIATLGSELFVTLTQLWCIRGEIPVKNIFPKELANRLFSAVTMSGVLYILKMVFRYLEIPYGIQLLICIFTGGVIYMAMELIQRDFMIFGFIEQVKLKIEHAASARKK